MNYHESVLPLWLTAEYVTIPYGCWYDEDTELALLIYLTLHCWRNDVPFKPASEGCI
jgi:hypothetical protein